MYAQYFLILIDFSLSNGITNIKEKINRNAPCVKLLLTSLNTRLT